MVRVSNIQRVLLAPCRPARRSASLQPVAHDSRVQHARQRQQLDEVPGPTCLSSYRENGHRIAITAVVTARMVACGGKVDVSAARQSWVRFDEARRTSGLGGRLAGCPQSAACGRSGPETRRRRRPRRLVASAAARRRPRPAASTTRTSAVYHVEIGGAPGGSTVEQREAARPTLRLGRLAEDPLSDPAVCGYRRLGMAATRREPYNPGRWDRRRTERTAPCPRRGGRLAGDGDEGGSLGTDHETDRRRHDRTALVEADRYPVSDLEVGQIHQGSVEDDALGVPDPGDRLRHAVKLCFTCSCVEVLTIPEGAGQVVSNPEMSLKRRHVSRGDGGRIGGPKQGS